MRTLALVAFAVLLAAPSQGMAQGADEDLLVPLAPKPAPKRAKKKAKARSVVDDPLAPTLGGPGELAVKLEPPISGARLFIDEQEVGPFPGAPHTVAPGEHLVVVRRPGYSDFKKKVKVAPGERVDVVATPEPLAGVLDVLANVPDAKVYVDGQLVGKAPIEDLVLAPGAHDIRVSREGYHDSSERAVLRAGKDHTFRADLQSAWAQRRESDAAGGADLTPAASPEERSPFIPANQADAVQGERTDRPWYGRWYVWAAAGAVVAGTAAGAMMLSNKPITPDQVCGGPCKTTFPGAVAF